MRAATAWAAAASDAAARALPAAGHSCGGLGSTNDGGVLAGGVVRRLDKTLNKNLLIYSHSKLPQHGAGLVASGNAFEAHTFGGRGANYKKGGKNTRPF